MQKYQWYILLVIIALLLVNNWSIPLWDQDEGAYAGFAYQMNESGNWLVPQFMYSEVHRKPPLHFWNIALSYRIFGYNEFAVRFPSFLAVLGTFLLMVFQGKKFLHESLAFRGMLVLAGSFLVTTMVKMSVTDATVLFTSTLSAFGIIQTLRKPNWKWIFLFWLGFALGILTKGPPIILFTGAFAGILFVLHPLRKNLLQLHPWFFLPLALAPAMLWGYLTYLKDGGVFLSWMYEWYVLKRINGNVFGQTGPIGTHFFGICLFFLPFLLYIPRALMNVIKGSFQKNESAIILFTWFLAGWLLYEFSPSKLPAYVIAAHVPFAFILAIELDKGFPFQTIFDKIFTSLHFIIQFTLGLGFCIVPWFLGLPQNINILFMTLGFVLLSITILILIKRKQPNLANYHLAGAILFTLIAWSMAAQITQMINSSKRVAAYIHQLQPQPQQVLIGHNFGNQPSLPFYILQNGNNPTDATKSPIEELVESFNNKPKTVLILSKAKYDLLNLYLGQTLPYQTVSTLIVDRNEKSDYYIVCTPDFNQ